MIWFWKVIVLREHHFELACKQLNTTPKMIRASYAIARETWSQQNYAIISNYWKQLIILLSLVSILINEPVKSIHKIESHTEE